MCGPAGSGKSTVAKSLEAEGYERLSFDQEAWSRGLRSMPLSTDDHAAIESALKQRLVRLVLEGRDVVLDFSFWSRQMRRDWRSVVEPLGVVPETIYLATDRQTCLDRIEARAMGHGDDFTLAPDVAAAYFEGFEVPVKTKVLCRSSSLSEISRSQRSTTCCRERARSSATRPVLRGVCSMG